MFLLGLCLLLQPDRLEGDTYEELLNHRDMNQERIYSNRKLQPIIATSPINIKGISSSEHHEVTIAHGNHRASGLYNRALSALLLRTILREKIILRPLNIIASGFDST